MTTQKCFLLDLNKCTGCHACVLACGIENELLPGMHWRQVVTFNQPHFPDIPLFHYSLACNHCLDAPCMVNCPALAYEKNETTGAVTVIADKCMGCKYCLWICPYDSPKYNIETGVMEKCTFCEHRLQENLEPACTTSCPTGALKFDKFTKLDEYTAKGYTGFFDRNIEPALKIITVRKKSEVPKSVKNINAEALSELASSFPRNKGSKVSLLSEWTLLVFTFTAAVLVPLFFAGFIADNLFPAWIFVLTGLAVMGLSTIHLGQRSRLFRVILNWRNSWLSRELISFSLFIAAGSMYLIFIPGFKALGWAVSLLGFASLFTMDKLYIIYTNLELNKVHSAHVFLTGLFLTGVFLGDTILFLPFGAVKLFLYLKRKLDLSKTGKETRPVLSLLRILSGFVLPVLLYFLTDYDFYAFIILSIVTGELIDRCEFYLELEFMRPLIQIEIDLEKMLKERINGD
ncbi:4Fe-4S dicluster domain-containing protein [candidate division KSB1 bacterium]